MSNMQKLLNVVDFVLRGMFVALWFLLTSFVMLTLAVLSYFLQWPFERTDPTLGYYFARMLGFGALRILRWSVVVENAERLQQFQPCIFVANHQSNFDIITYTALYQKNTVAIGKKELSRVPVFGFFFKAAGNILIDRANSKNALAELKRVQERAQSHQLSIWIFPEGTRNKGSLKLLPFKKGAFHLARGLGVNIVPIVHSPLHLYFDKKNLRFIPTQIKIRVLEPIMASEIQQHYADDLEKLIELVHSRMQHSVSSGEVRCESGAVPQR